MSSVRVLLVGMIVGLALGGGAVLVMGGEPSLTIRNGALKGWEVTRDKEELICRDPIIFIRVRQIECE